MGDWYFEVIMHILKFSIVPLKTTPQVNNRPMNIWKNPGGRYKLHTTSVKQLRAVSCLLMHRVWRFWRLWAGWVWAVSFWSSKQPPNCGAASPMSIRVTQWRRRITPFHRLIPAYWWSLTLHSICWRTVDDGSKGGIRLDRIPTEGRWEPLLEHSSCTAADIWSPCSSDHPRSLPAVEAQRRLMLSHGPPCGLSAARTRRFWASGSQLSRKTSAPAGKSTWLRSSQLYPAPQSIGSFFWFDFQGAALQVVSSWDHLLPTDFFYNPLCPCQC